MAQDNLVDVGHGGGASSPNRVHLEFTAPHVPDDYVVVSFEAIEELNRPYVVRLDLAAKNEAVDSTELVGQDAQLTLERDDHQRTFFGIVRRVTVHDDHRTQQTSTVELVPALMALGLRRTTRIFQDQTALEIVERVLTAELGVYDRRIDVSGLDPSRYLKRDYCVQYQETDLDFVHRLLEEEGVGYHFGQDDETLVLFDDNRQLRDAQTMDGGPVRFDAAVHELAGSEPIRRFASTLTVTSTRVVVRDHDWTRSRPVLEESVDAETEPAPRDQHEIYDHGFRRGVTIHEDSELLSTMVDLAQRALMPDGLPSGMDRIVHNVDGALLDGFSSSDIEHQASVRHELMRRDRHLCEGSGLVVGFSAGAVFELVGHPTLGADGEYFLTKVVHRGVNASGPVAARSDEALSAERRDYLNEFECLPSTTQWRPARSVRKPRIYGVQTARVTGPVGMDVHTDQHGRIKARFPWDRADEDPSGNYTCWLRVSQAWAGNGFPGFMFVPRVGMEVIVAFVDGDPDRPLVTGCVYNGQNPTPGLLPLQATKSIIRTRTVPHGPGHNELSFEDAMGIERVHIRAQRDLDELVLHDHLTRVSANQTNRVGVDQTEEIRRHQDLMVRGHRTKTVRGDNLENMLSDSRVNVAGSDHRHVGGNSDVLISGGASITTVQNGEWQVNAKHAVVLTQGDEQFFEMYSEDDDAQILLDSKGSTISVSEEKIELKVGDSSIVIKSGMIQVNGKTFPAV